MEHKPAIIEEGFFEAGQRALTDKFTYQVGLIGLAPIALVTLIASTASGFDNIAIGGFGTVLGSWQGLLVWLILLASVLWASITISLRAKSPDSTSGLIGQGFSRLPVAAATLGIGLGAIIVLTVISRLGARLAGVEYLGLVMVIAAIPLALAWLLVITCVMAMYAMVPGLVIADDKPGVSTVVRRLQVLFTKTPGRTIIHWLAASLIAIGTFLILSPGLVVANGVLSSIAFQAIGNLRMATASLIFVAQLLLNLVVSWVVAAGYFASLARYTGSADIQYPAPDSGLAQPSPPMMRPMGEPVLGSQVPPPPIPDAGPEAQAPFAAPPLSNTEPAPQPIPVASPIVEPPSFGDATGVPPSPFDQPMAIPDPIQPPNPAPVPEAEASSWFDQLPSAPSADIAEAPSPPPSAQPDAHLSHEPVLPPDLPDSEDLVAPMPSPDPGATPQNQPPAFNPTATATFDAPILPQTMVPASDLGPAPAEASSIFDQPFAPPAPPVPNSVEFESVLVDNNDTITAPAGWHPTPSAPETAINPMPPLPRELTNDDTMVVDSQPINNDICGACGAENPPGYRFCSACGQVAPL